MIEVPDGVGNRQCFDRIAKTVVDVRRPATSADHEQFATGRGEIFNVLMKIGPEWVRVLSRDFQDVDTFLIDRRGQRGTARVNHAAETPVYFGRVYDVTVTIPSYRDDNN